MKLKQILSIAIGIGSVGLLSSVFAKLQGMVFPQSLNALGHPDVSSAEVIQLVIKLGCLATSGMLGGILTAWTGGNLKARVVVCIAIIAVIGWLWFNTIYPIWFWLPLIILIGPAILLGGKLPRKQS
ncbi:hypothetical protein C7T94_02150 [Pedobacter yulinensis]|uniref:Uncharacterized protein n=1 Tax=Pedobacter yulinensis TaxID=2126353 RepID=A0A2T3HR56_9SPHI|nr:hypothetical protein [Pedobacter yulinensis]PST84945.1 hypothetical protein C7T94_02150 [Pedobacter yulinensis]